MFRLLDALKNKSFLALWIAELCSQVAMNMMNFLFILFAFHLTSSNTAVSGIVLAFTLPALFFGILAGVYVDHWNKKHVLVATNILRALILLLFIFFQSNLAMLYAAAFLVSIITQFFIPAETPMIPLVVEKEKLFSANALFSMAWFGSVFVAYGLSGPLLLLAGQTNSIIVLIVFFVLGGIAAAFIKQHTEDTHRSHPPTRQHLFREAYTALRDIYDHEDVRHAFFLLALTQVLTLIIAVLGPGFAQNVLAIPVDAFPIVVLTPAIVGMIIGSLFATNVLYRYSRHKSANLGIFLGALAVAAMALSPQITRIVGSFGILPFDPHTLLLVDMVIIAVVLGIANAFMFVPSNTLIQEQTKEEERGKIYGALNSMVALISLVPVLLVGTMADIFGVVNVLITIAVCIGVLGILRIRL